MSVRPDARYQAGYAIAANLFPKGLRDGVEFGAHLGASVVYVIDRSVENVDARRVLFGAPGGPVTDFIKNAGLEILKRFALDRLKDPAILDTIADQLVTPLLLRVL